MKCKTVILAACLSVIPGLVMGYVNHSNAVVRVLNKDAGKVQEVIIPTGQEMQFEKLFINVRDCKQSDPFDAENYFAFVEISEIDKGQIFGGWMNRNEPGLNPLQHPNYDVWLVKCE